MADDRNIFSVKSALIGVLVAVISIAVAVPILKWRAQPQFVDVTFNPQEAELRTLAKRATLNPDSASYEDVLSCVGLVLVVDEGEAAKGEREFRQDRVLPHLRPDTDKVKIEPLSKKLYEGKISNEFSVAGKYTEFTAGMKENQAAEVVITDEVRVGYKNSNDIPYRDLRRLPIEEGKRYFFVEAATLTSVTYRMYEQTNSDGKFNGTAFGANGKIYVSNQGFTYKPLVSLRVWDVELLKSAEGGANDTRRKIQTLLLKHVRDQATDAERQELTGLLNDESAGAAEMLRGASIEREALKRRPDEAPQ